MNDYKEKFGSWAKKATSKIEELDAQMVKLRAMRRLVDRVSACECPELADCGRIALSVIESAR